LIIDLFVINNYYDVLNVEITIDLVIIIIYTLDISFTKIVIPM